MSTFYTVHFAVIALLILVIFYNLFRAATRKEINSFGLGWADKASSPGLFVAYIVLNLAILAMLLCWIYGDYVRLFGRIPGFDPEGLIGRLKARLF